jgi:type IV pilus assembly protein PilA
LNTRKSFTLIELMIVIAIIAIIAAIAIPNLLSARKNGNEAAAIGSLKAIVSAQTVYREGDKNGDGSNEYAPTLAALTDTGSTGTDDLIDEILASGTRQGYNFTLTVPGPPQNRFVWTCHADAVVQGTTGDRHFGAAMAGLIFFNATAQVTFSIDGSSTDPVVGN